MSINELRADYLLDKYIYSKDFSGLSTGSYDWIYPSLLILVTLIYSLLIVRKVLSFRKSFKENSILLELTPPAMTEKTAYTTQQLFSVIHNLGKQRSFMDKVIGKKTLFACEIVSTQNQGIRYLIRTTPDLVNNLKRSLISYMPQVNVKTVNEYLPEKMGSYHTKVIELNQTKHFAYPLEKQNILIEHDPVAYITGMMTKLSPGELISLQIVLTPTEKKVTSFIKHKILRGEDVLGYINQLNGSIIANLLVLPLKIIQVLLGIIGYVLRTVITDFADAKMAQRQAQGQYLAYYATQNLQKPARVLTNFEQEIVKSIEGKIDQSLFEAKIRILIGVKDKAELNERVRGFTSSFGIFSATSNQSLKKRLHLPLKPINKSLMLSFQKRLLSLASNSSPTVLSISEVSDLYHFPFTRVTQTENIIKAHSKELPAPVSLKKGRIMDSVFGVNTYGGTNTEIGLTEEERQTHMYILGRTGSGKTTLMFTMAKHDIETGKGLVFIDPHGDVSEDLVASVPLSRKDDLIYVNPTDLKHPIGINLLELTPGLDEDEAELEKEVVAEGMVSLFRKVFSKEENTNAHRIEYILRNTIYTAFTTEGCTIFTINKILTNPTFRKQVVSRLKDPELVDFWKYEFGKAGDYQVVKMTQGVTAKVGRFLRSPTARRILEQEKSTINFDDIINQGKILICNFSQKLGEDTSRLLGTTIMTKLQQAALKRAYIPENERKTFYLYVDEFQNFATQSFTKMVTEGRKYRMPLIIAEQSTSQQKDRDITNIILANITTVVSFRSGNYIDEDLMLNQFAPYLEKGEIMNLPRYKFYIKISAIESEEPFSGTTLYFPVVKDAEKIEQLIEASRKNWAIDYKRKTESEVSVPVIEKTISTTPIHNDQTKKRNGFPESIR
jgi:energy-coupling factor transporter ATP-binding protein EcfA2